MKPYLHRTASIACTLLACTLPVVIGGACADPPSLVAYDVVLTTTSDCTKTGQGNPSCEDAATVDDTLVKGRWIMEYQDTFTFTLTTEAGDSLPGITFKDDGATATTGTCKGDSPGICHFARRSTRSTDPVSSCFKQTEHSIDVIDLDGQLTGQMFNATSADAACGTEVITQVIVQIEGTVADEPVFARVGVAQ